EADRGEQGNGRGMRETRAPEKTTFAEPRRERVEPLFAVDLEIEERVEKVEAGHPERDSGAKRPGRPGQFPSDRDPRADGCEAVDSTQPEMREPGPALQIRVDDKRGNGDRPEPAHDRVELKDRDQEERERGDAKKDDLATAQQTAGKLPRGRPRIARVDGGI